MSKSGECRYWKSRPKASRRRPNVENYNDRAFYFQRAPCRRFFELQDYDLTVSSADGIVNRNSVFQFDEKKKENHRVFAVFWDL